jgi:hypothetical protein
VRVVQLAHHRSAVGTCRRATVHIFTDTKQIVRLLRAEPQRLSEASRGRIEELIARDHRRFSAPRRRR